MPVRAACGVVEVHPDADNGVGERAVASVHGGFGKDATELAACDHEVVGQRISMGTPADSSTAAWAARPAASESLSASTPNRRGADEDADVEAVAGDRMPGVAAASAPGGLLISPPRRR